MSTTRCSYAKSNPIAAYIAISNGVKKDHQNRFLRISRAHHKKEKHSKQPKAHPLRTRNVTFADGLDLRETSSSTTA